MISFEQNKKPLPDLRNPRRIRTIFKEIQLKAYLNKYLIGEPQTRVEDLKAMFQCLAFWRTINNLSQYIEKLINKTKREAISLKGTHCTIPKGNGNGESSC